MRSENSTNRAHARERGAASMEMVIICVLIAVACLLGVIVFGRALMRNTGVMGEGLSGQGERAGKALSCPNEGYRKQHEDDIKEAVKYQKEFSDVEK